jgi:hypothetical protein
MIDSATNKPIRVSDENKEYLSIRVSVQDLNRVVALLEANSVRFWVAHNQISFNGGPFMARINLRRGTEARSVQGILDGTV